MTRADSSAETLPCAASGHPCLSCGACCAVYRVSFYWTEMLTRKLPEALTAQVNSWMSCMVGTETQPVRCAALAGDVGRSVTCMIYDQRPSPCRSVEVGDEKCNRAREHRGLPAISMAEGARARD